MECRKACTITDLPSEVLLEIFNYCIFNINDLINVTKVCRKFSDVFHTFPNVFDELHIDHGTSCKDFSKFLRSYRQYVRMISTCCCKDMCKLFSIFKNLDNLYQLDISCKNLKTSNNVLPPLYNMISECKNLQILNLYDADPLTPKKKFTKLLQSIAKLDIYNLTFHIHLPDNCFINLSSKDKEYSISNSGRILYLCLFIEYEHKICLEDLHLISNNIRSLSIKVNYNMTGRVETFLCDTRCECLESLKITMDCNYLWHPTIIPHIMNFCVNLKRLHLLQVIYKVLCPISSILIHELFEKCTKLKHVRLSRLAINEILEFDKLFVEGKAYQSLLSFGFLCYSKYDPHYENNRKFNPITKAELLKKLQKFRIVDEIHHIPSPQRGLFPPRDPYSALMILYRKPPY